ncbi:hypothetical protein [Roseivivax sediminis]|uniref:HdeA/HdeB family protein n=1 Tax=Roseivivax sediminis TaxID=936889 RepID=A0A1I1SQV6_9RHOB|nr:hypothetical protein [Roseivivax sediminis]SFD45450.1 hypothetical protein SAMN04515678_101151 [Roseivivax sediminis]
MKQALFAMLLTAAAIVGPAATAQDKAEECNLQADMVMAVVNSRGEGVGAEEAVETVQSNLSGPEAKYASVVPAVVDWVYTLPEDQLGDGVGQSWVEACLAR